MSDIRGKTLRMLFPQWQGGNNPDYALGARLLAWLAPDSDDPLVEVPLVPAGQQALELENGIVGRSALLEQAHAARKIIEAHAPDRIVVFGGDCLVDLAPFAYLSEKYGESFGVLWIDAHPDVATPNERPHGHTMVLGNLLGQGDPEFSALVDRPLHPERVMLAGLGRLSEQEASFIERLSLQQVSPSEIAMGTNAVLDWIAATKIKHLAIHLDLDVLDPTLFRALSFAKPQLDEATTATLRTGTATFAEIIRLVTQVSEHTDVVALGITEHIPWEALNLKAMLEQFPILSSSQKSDKTV